MATPAQYDAITPIHRPWALAQVLGAMVADQLGLGADRSCGAAR